ncbi:MAG: T9SS type A sorting domain-containing protein [Candidatus Delongbacteria bacterium]|nr:T9SS type A sorting domain-containing protein [Candidatus Delongbacteria bacterium]
MRSIYYRSILLLIVALWTLPALAQDSLNVERIGTVPLDFDAGSPTKLVYADGLVFLAADYAGIFIVDVTDPSNPWEVVGFPGLHTTDVEVAGNLMFVADQYEGLMIYDITIPADPQFVGSYTVDFPDAEIESLEEDNGVVYLGVDNYGVIMIDVSVPGEPGFLGEYTGSDNIGELALEGDYLYISTNSVYFTVLDISTPETPQVVYSEVLGLACSWVEVEERLTGVGIFQGPNDYGIRLYDFTDISNPTAHGWLQLSTYDFHFEVYCGYLFTMDGNNGIRIFDLADLNNPVETGYFVEPRLNQGLTVNENLIYAWYDGDFIVLEFTAMQAVATVGGEPALFILAPACPNPFNPVTTLPYTLTAPAQVLLTVYNLSGRRVATLVEQLQPAGEYRSSWDGSRYASGCYFAQLLAGKQQSTQKLLLLK